MSNIVNNLTQVWQQASLTHRATLVGIVIAFLAVSAFLVNWASQPDMALLYGGLSATDAAKITDKLRDDGVQYQLRDGGTTILVPNEKVYALRLTMVSQGLPTGGNEGYRILDRDSLGISPFKEKVNYIRAIEGELVRTIKLIGGVVSARVHVVSEDRGLMARGRQEASATVVLKTTGGQRITKGNVAAITNLVSGAVKGVSPDKVVVVVNGVLEAGKDQDETAFMSGTMFEYKMQMEKYLASKAEEMLTRALGPNRASVKVNATLTTASIQKTKRTLDTTNRTESRIVSKQKKVDAVAATRGNSKPSAGSKDVTEEIDYETPYEIEQRMEGPGKVESLAVAVFVDLSGGAVAGDVGEGEQAGEPGKKLTAEAVQKIVCKAIGVDKNSVEVVDVPFHQADDAATKVEEAGMFNKDLILEIARKGSLGVVVLGMLLALKILKGKKGKDLAVATTGEGGEGAVGGMGAAPVPRAIRGGDKQLRAKITTALHSNPEQVKKLFLSWVESSNSE